jgi:hypothetical protein
MIVIISEFPGLIRCVYSLVPFPMNQCTHRIRFSRDDRPSTGPSTGKNHSMTRSIHVFFSWAFDPLILTIYIYTVYHESLYIYNIIYNYIIYTACICSCYSRYIPIFLGEYVVLTQWCANFWSQSTGAAPFPVFFVGYIIFPIKSFPYKIKW